MMSREINPEVDYHNPISIFDRKFDSPRLREFAPGMGGIASSNLIFADQPSLPLNDWHQSPLLNISEILQKLQLCQPLRTCPQQRALASKALTALKHRCNQDFRILASSLAEDVASRVD